MDPGGGGGVKQRERETETGKRQREKKERREIPRKRQIRRMVQRETVRDSLIETKRDR